MQGVWENVEAVVEEEDEEEDDAGKDSQLDTRSDLINLISRSMSDKVKKNLLQSCASFWPLLRSSSPGNLPLVAQYRAHESPNRDLCWNTNSNTLHWR